jgi:ATP/ADP translocase
MPKHLITWQKFKSNVELFSQSISGRLFPILPTERSRLFYIALNYVIVGLIYNAMRIFKELITYREISVAASNWLKIVSLILSFEIIKFVNKSFRRLGPYKGSLAYNYISIAILILLSILIVVDNFIFKWIVGGTYENMYCGGSLSIRGFGWTDAPALILFNLVPSLYYVVFDILGSLLMALVFSSFFAGTVDNRVYKRYNIVLKSVINITTGVSAEGIGIVMRTIGNVSAVAFYKVYIGIALVLMCCFIVLIGTNYLMNESLKVPIFEGDSVKKAAPTKSKQLSYSELLRLFFKSQLLRSLCIVSFSYNFFESVFAMYSSTVYDCYANFLIDNPELNESGIVPSKASIALPFKQIETKYAGLVSSYITLNPFVLKLFNRFGVLLYGNIPILFGIENSVCMLIFSVINFPFTREKSKVLGCSFIPKFRQMFHTEAVVATFNVILLRVSKYIFYDIAFENVFASMSPDQRVLFRGISEGMVNKLSKMISSLWIILCDIIFVKGMYFYSPITTMVVIFLGFLYFCAIVYIGRCYKRFKKSSEYLVDL